MGNTFLVANWENLIMANYEMNPSVLEQYLPKGVELDFYKKISETITINTSGLTLFLPHGTQSELQKANEVAKELKEKYGVEEVNLFALHCFVQRSNQFGSQALFIYKQGFYQKDCVSSEEKQYVFNNCKKK